MALLSHDALCLGNPWEDLRPGPRDGAEGSFSEEVHVPGFVWPLLFVGVGSTIPSTETAGRCEPPLCLPAVWR